MRTTLAIHRQVFRTITRLISQDQANLEPLPERFTRAEAIEIWGVPRMTANHRLSGLVDAGLLVRFGRGNANQHGGGYRRVG